MTESAFRLTPYRAAMGLLLVVASSCDRSERQKAGPAADGGDGAVDANASCPPNSPRISHSCGNGAAATTCYYPALGELPQSFNSSCNDLTLVCCADPGPSVSAASYCATDNSQPDQAEIMFTERAGSECLTALMFQTASGAASYLPPGYGYVVGYRGACDASPSDPRRSAIGFLGSVAISAFADGGTVQRFDVHLVFFFDNGSGTPDTARIDVDRLAVGSCVGAPDGGAADADGG
jgi:hypothetical protein